jgi:hypothetical protein
MTLVHGGSKAGMVKRLTEAWAHQLCGVWKLDVGGATGRAHSGGPYRLLERVVEGQWRADDGKEHSAVRRLERKWSELRNQMGVGNDGWAYDVFYRVAEGGERTGDAGSPVTVGYQWRRRFQSRKEEGGESGQHQLDGGNEDGRMAHRFNSFLVRVVDW